MNKPSGAAASPGFNYIPARKGGPRLSQAEKTARIRRRVLDSAISCLVDVGYARASTSQIAERAGLSRTSQLYHFPSKEELLTGAVEYLLELRLAQLRHEIAEMPAASDLWNEIVLRIWRMQETRLFFAWLELVVASRTDRKLRSKLATVNRRLNERIENFFLELVNPSKPRIPRFKLTIYFLFFATWGMSIERTVGDFDRAPEILQILSDTARSLNPTSAEQRLMTTGNSGRTRRKT